MTVRIRGIYATALTAMLDDVVQPSPAIAERIDDALPVEPAAASIATTSDRQGVRITGDPERVADLRERLTALALDSFGWSAPLPRDAVFAGAVEETLGAGAIVDVDDGTGFLPFDRTDRRIEPGDRLRVQVAEPRAPWVDERPVLDTAIRVRGPLVSLDRGGTPSTARTGGPTLEDVVPASPPDGWAPRWHRTESDVSLSTRSSALDRATRRARGIDEALSAADAPAEHAPGPYWTDVGTAHCWFGRATRFSMDAHRRSVTTTMAGHHRIKTATDAASAAVDLVEAVCGSAGDASEDENPDGSGDFPFAAVTDQFGPTAGDSIRIGHGKPDGSLVELGHGAVTECRDDGTVVVERELSGGGTYDGLGVDREAGDIATTKFTEGRWWYPTVYRSASGDPRGTYVNVCTPVEVFPSTVRYVDLHVDVVKHADGRIERLDDDELATAVSAGHVSEALASKARSVATAIERGLD